MTFLLTVIDVFTKVAWCVPLKNKSATSMVAALTTTFTKSWPHTLHADQELEYLNISIQALLKKNGIHHFSTHNAETKASIVERFNSTLKTRMWRYFTKHQTWRYVDVLQDLVQSSNTPHRSIDMTQLQINPKNQEIFTIHEVHPSDLPVYRLNEDLGEVLDGTFYEPELQKGSVPVDKVYRVESVLQRRKVVKRTEALMVRLPIQIQPLDRSQGPHPL